jgi:calcineurin-like phosphoesterase family protein
MMPNIFIISDTHWGHKAATETFKRDDGTPLRPFATVEECDEAMVENWNKVVAPSDKVYHLGDVIMPKDKKNAAIMHRLNGTKVLIKGNHDMESLDFYKQFFKDVRGSHRLDNIVLTHIPVHPGSLTRWRANIHGHLHYGSVMEGEQEDPKYFCASVEKINFAPMPFEEINQIFKNRGI